MNHQSRRTFLRQLSLSLLAGMLPAQVSFGRESGSPLPLIIDADTANEVDDLFAIAVGLLEPNLEVKGLTSAQWHTAKHGSRDKVGESQELNEIMLQLMGKSDLPHPIGSNFPLVSPHRPQPSPAAEFIVVQAMAQPEGQLLEVVILGPATNVASAILMEPDIIPKLSVNYLGFWHHPETNTWSKREFNTNNDPIAVDVLLNTPSLKFRIMTASTSQHLVFDKEVVDQHLKGRAGIGDLLVDRWEGFDRTWQETDKEKRHWVMWDVAIILALANPDLATQAPFQSPHDNLDRTLEVYTLIDVPAMKARYWELLDGYGKG